MDCAQVYTNEQEVGQGIADGLAATGLRREDIYITGKCWNTHRKAEHVKMALNESLANLGCAYLDMYLIHWPQSYKYLPRADAKPDVNCVAPVVNGAAMAPEYFPMLFDGKSPKHPGGGDGKAGTMSNDCVYAPNGVAFSETWQAFEETVDNGLVKAIGVANFTPAHMDEILKIARHPISCNQIEHHPYLQQPKLKEYCKTKGIPLVGYATLLNPSLQGEKSAELWEEPILVSIAAKHSKSVPQVLIRWAIQAGVAPLVKSVSPDRMQQNIQVCDFAISADDMVALAKLDRCWRHNSVPSRGVVSAFVDEDLVAAVAQDASAPATKMPRGKAMPMPGYGTFLSRTAGETRAAVKEAIIAGYRHMDCAQVYTNEQEVGQGIADGLAATGLRREDIYITGKCWNTHRKAEHVKMALNESLANLGCAYLDMYLIHWPQSYKYLPRADAKPDVNCVAPVVNGAAMAPEYFPMLFDGKSPKHPGGGDGKAGTMSNDCVYAPNGVAFSETWQAFEETVDNGLVKAIGVANFTPAHMDEILKIARHPISCNQIEHHPYLQQPKLKEYCKTKGIPLVGYATLLNPSLQGEKSAELWEEPILVSIAAKHSKSVPQVLIRWAIQAGVVPLVKSVSPDRTQQNIQVHDCTISTADMADIAKLDCGWRHNSVPSGGVVSAFDGES